MADNLTPEQIDALIAERDELKQNLEAANARASAEAQRADSADAEGRTAQTRLAEAVNATASANAQQATQAVNHWTAQIAQLKTELVNATTEGDFTKAADIQEKIGDATAQRNTAAQSKAYFEQQAEQAKTRPTDPVEIFLTNNPDFSDREREWIRKNPRYARDRGFRERANSAHHEALSRGFPHLSDDYFKHLEDAGYMRPVAVVPKQGENETDPDSPFSSAAVETEDPKVTTPPARPRTAAAPPSRRAPTVPDNRRAGRVLAELSADQMETAYRMAELTAPKDVLEGGAAAIANWWRELDTGAMATRKREEWAAQ